MAVRKKTVRVASVMTCHLPEMMWSRGPSRLTRNPRHLQITCSAAQRNKTGCGALLQRPPWLRARRERSIGPPVSTRRTGAPKSGRPRRRFCSSTRQATRTRSDCWRETGSTLSCFELWGQVTW